MTRTKMTPYAQQQQRMVWNRMDNDCNRATAQRAGFRVSEDSPGQWYASAGFVRFGKSHASEADAWRAAAESTLYWVS